MPVTVRFDPTVLSPQSQVITDATAQSDGVMTKEQAAALAKLASQQIVTLAWNGLQPLDGDFPFRDVTWLTPFTSAGVYAVFPSLQTSSPVVVWEKAGARTATGTRILASDQFTGTTEVKGELK